MRTSLLLFACAVLLSPLAHGVATNDHRTKNSGQWDLASTWQRYNGSTWIDAENPPTSADAAVNIRAGHSVSVAYAASVDQIVIDEGGTLTIESGVTFTIDDGTGDDLTVYGTLDIVGTLQCNAGGGGFKVFGTVRNAGTLNGQPWYYASGRYQHNYTGTVGYIPASAWYGSSTCEIIGYTSFTGNMSVGSQTFVNITWNCENQTGAINVPSQFDNLTGAFTVTSTGSGSLVFNNTTGAKSYVLNGAFIQNGGTVDLASNSGSTNLNVEGAVSLLGGTLTETGSAGSSYLRFTGTTDQNFTVNSAHTTANDVDFRSWPGSIVVLTQNANIDAATFVHEGTLNCGQFVLSGAGFSNYPNSTLSTGNDFGIAASAASGSIQTTSRSFDTEAIYVYNHPSSMSYSGDGIPSTVKGLTSANTGGTLQMQKNVTVSGTLVLTSPVQVGTSGGNTLTLQPLATYSGASYVALDGSGTFVRYTTGAGSYTLPVGSPGSSSPVTVTVSGSAFAAPHIDVSITDAKHAANTSASHYITRSWTLTASGITSPQYDLSFTYTNDDIVGVESGIYCGRHNGSVWTLGNQTNSGSNTMSINGLTSLGDFTGGEMDALPVQLASLSATAGDAGITLAWRTLSELNNYGFHIQRRVTPAGTFEDIPGAFVQGNGTTVEEHSYTFSEPVPGPGTWEYRLRQVDLDGSEWFSDAVSITGVTDVPVAEVPGTFVLEQNYPNPFNPSTTVRFGVPAATHVRIVLYDMLGRTVQTLVDEERTAGMHQVVVDASGLSSGVYLCRMQAGDFTQSVRLVLAR